MWVSVLIQFLVGAGLRGFLTWLISKFGDLIAKIGIKTVVLAAYVVLLIAITAAYISSMKGLYAMVYRSVPQVVSDVWGWVMPDNFNLCVGVMITARLLRWAHDKFYDLLKTKVKVLSS